MLGFFGDVTLFLKFDTVCIDNHVFKLHYKATVIILVIASLLVTGNQYIGDPIDCMCDGIPGGIIDTYCWIHSTFSIPERFVGKQGIDVAFPGVAPIEVDGKEPRYHKYYQWVCFVLMLQAAFCFAPRFVWKGVEDGKIKMLVQDMTDPDYVVNAEKRKDRINLIVKYFREFRGGHAAYSFKFFTCELFNLIIIISQIFFMDRFLGYEFSEYGLDVLGYTELDPRERPDPMAVVFPKITKCTFRKYGASGSIEKYDALCVLPLNIINEKIYTFLWFWFIIVASVTGLYMLYRVFIILGAGLRVALIQSRTGRGLPREKLEDILNEKTLNILQKNGDFFLLHLVTKNLDEMTNKELLEAIHLDLYPATSIENKDVDGSNGISTTSV
ncbi:innexin inx2 [Eurytemora carolleeae]|uniref:innexin inx2 n=1 Tax=Eurytemora carolleeae TaxID=1294199 RepID=UPI000C787C9C|nr:innexin inx2 [Eurytemora carolleeae]|eukprot:XP_023324987.1 innexin inx2-like [Eurytemora affinis]